MLASRTATPKAVRKPHAGEMDVREGDQWSFLTNTGYLVRNIVSVGDKYIGYREPGSLQTRACLKTTFRRWWRGATLTYATDWTGR